MKRLHLLLSVTFAGLVIYALLWRFDVGQTMTSVRNARPPLLAAAALLLVVSYLLRGARWRIWERSLTYWDSLRLILIGFMGNNTLPARLGEVLRAHCAAAKTGRDRGRTTALASIAIERVLDGLVLALFGLVSLALVPVDRRLELALFGVSLFFAILTSAIILGIRFQASIRAFLAGVHRRFPGHLTDYAHRKAVQFVEGFLPLGTLLRVAGALLTTVAVWSLEIALCYLIGLAVWDDMTVPIAVLFLVVVNFASLVPITVGGIGSIEVVAPVFLVSAGVPPASALAMVLVQHGFQYVLTTATGGVFYLTGGFSRIPLAHPKRAARRRARIVPRTATRSGPSAILETTRLSLGQLAQLKPLPRGTIELSVVIPAYNEQARLPRTVLEVVQWCSDRQLDFELIIADDGSRDETLEIGRLFEESDSRVRTLACPHMGKGAAVRMGMLNAKGRHVLFMDADGATPLNEIPKLTAALEAGYDVAIGSRVVQQPGQVEVEARLYRRIIGRVFALFVNIVALEGFGDTQCGFKMFRREAAAAIFPFQKIVGFAFDVEILFVARRLALSITEIPVNWIAQPGSKVNIATDSVKMLWDICHIRWLHRDLGAAVIEDGLLAGELPLDESGA